MRGKLIGITVRTLQDIQLRIGAEELILTEDSTEVKQENTPSTLVSMGLSIEDQQCILECTKIYKALMTKKQAAIGDRDQGIAGPNRHTGPSVRQAQDSLAQEDPQVPPAAACIHASAAWLPLRPQKSGARC
jgi:hypothetical protein